MSRKITSGANCLAAVIAVAPSWASLVTWPRRDTASSSISAASRLSSTISTRRLRLAATGGCSAGDACRGRHRRDWQTDFDLGPLTRPRTSDVDLPFVHLHQPPRQRQPDAQATGRSFEDRFRLLEHVEHPREDVGGDSDPRIADAHDSLIGLLVGGEPDVSAARRELHRVVEDVRKDLHEPRAIAVDKDRRRRQVDTSSVWSAAVASGMMDFDGSRHQAREVVRFTTQLDLIGGDPGHIQEVIDEAHELPDLTLDHITGARRGRRRGVGLQSLEREPNRVRAGSGARARASRGIRPCVDRLRSVWPYGPEPGAPGLDSALPHRSWQSGDSR